MSGLTRISPLLLAGALAAWAQLSIPVARADTTESEQQASAATLQRQETELRQILKAHPDDAAMHLKLGQIYLDQARYGLAEEQARAARHGNGQYRDQADALLAWSLFLENEKDILLSEIKPGNREPHAESVVRMSLGLALLNSSSFSSAEPLLRDAVRLDPSSWRARIALARLLILERKLPEAREQIEAARETGADEVGVTRIAAELDRAAGNTDQAIAEFSKVIKEHPTSVPALAGRADALISLDKLDEARKDVEAALHIVKNSQLVFLDALILAREGKYDEASRQLIRISPVLGHMPIGYYLHGVVDFRLGLAETADNYLARFQARQPHVSGVRRVRAEIALKRKDAPGAIDLLKPLIEANPGDHAAVTMLARAYLSNGQPEQVIQLYEQVVTAAPHQGSAPLDMTGLLMMYGDASGDLTEIEKVIMREAPEVVLPMKALRDGDVAKAAQIAQSLSESKPNDPWVQNLLGSVRLAQNRIPEAEAIFRHILDKQPAFTPAAFNLVEVLVAEKRLDDAKAMLKNLDRRALNDSVL